jgi:large subunit ribosomal protein L13
MKTMKTYTTKPSHVESRWHVFDAKDRVLGRLATEVSGLLQGKHKSIYARNILTGDFVVVVNVAQVKITGHKLEQKLYRHHSDYPGGLRETTMAKMRQNHPDRILREAVRGMLPKTILGRQMLGRLKIYATDTHPHGAQVKDMASPALVVVPAQVEMGGPLHVDVEANEQLVDVIEEESPQAEIEESTEESTEDEKVES